ncbi:hypothetical protein A2635_04335 [Candidatus Peribacteria bacterium RIFCSPHIGHO2_01_FULL_51_9]|nr:MAG: hypothetical protein A2635_04335 [Candidatus Peribacteria bacterium RIFCSPHIGHO2_01_FULL_51_9]
MCIGIAYAQELHVVISEVMWAGTDLSTADEWLELTGIYNGTGSIPALSLSGWTITRLNDGAEETMMRFGEGIVIGSGTRLVVSNYSEDESRLFIDPNVVSSAVSLSNTKLLLRLRMASGSLVDSIDDGVGAPFAGSNVDPKASMERIDFSGSGGLKSNWNTATTFLGFDDGANLFGTPGFSNGAGPSVDIFAPRDATDLSAYIISGALSVGWLHSVALDLDHQVMNIVPSLRNGSGSITLAKTTSGFVTTDIVTLSGYMLTLVSVDVSGNASTGITIASQPFPEVRITEVLSNPIGTDDDEWIEVGNLGSTPLNIEGWILDEGNSPGNFVIPSRSDSDFVLAVGEHVVFRKPQTGLPLGNDGERLTLKKGSLMIDQWEYPETEEEVSYGRDPTDPKIFRPFCVPTPGRSNVVTLLDPKIVIQSGETSAEEKVTVNLQVESVQGSLDSVACQWDYGDGFESDSCNPPSHTISAVGGYDIRLTMDTFCGDRIVRTLHVNVLEPQNSEARSSGGDGGGGSRGNDRDIPESCVPKVSTGVVVNEILPDPVGKDTEGEWIELHNLTMTDASLCGWWLDDEEGGSRPFVLDAYEVSANGFLVLPYTVTKLGLRNAGEHVRLFMNENLLDDVTYDEAPEGQSFARGESGAFLWTSILTPGSGNLFVREEEIVDTGSGQDLLLEAHEPYILEVFLSEIFPSPSPSHVMVSSVEPRRAKGGDLLGTEWLEIFNPTNHIADLSGWVLDDAREKGSKPWIIPEGIEIQPNDFLVFTKEQIGLQLNNDGDEAVLLAPDESVFDSVTMPGVPYDRSWSRVHNRWCLSSKPSPGLPNHCDEFVPQKEASLPKVYMVATPVDHRTIHKPSLAMRTIYRNVSLEDRAPDIREMPDRLAPLRAQILPNTLFPLPFKGEGEGEGWEYHSFTMHESLVLVLFLITAAGMLILSVTGAAKESFTKM